MSVKRSLSFENLLREGGYKVTPGRLAILGVLESKKEPVTIAEIAARLRGRVNQTTIYRALEALAGSGLVRKVRLQDALIHYELAAGVGHHHHIVCEKCGVVEDVEDCHDEKMERDVLKKSRKFGLIKSHSVEFFGACRKCLKTA